jgi:hypothetical protein
MRRIVLELCFERKVPSIKEISGTLVHVFVGYNTSMEHLTEILTGRIGDEEMRKVRELWSDDLAEREFEKKGESLLISNI